MHALFSLVTKYDGFEKVQGGKKWRELALQLGVPKTCTSATAQLRSNYLKYLYAYERFKFTGVQLSRPELANQQRALANKGESRALGILDDMGGACGSGAGGQGSPGEPVQARPPNVPAGLGGHGGGGGGGGNMGSSLSACPQGMRPAGAGASAAAVAARPATAAVANPASAPGGAAGWGRGAAYGSSPYGATMAASKPVAVEPVVPAGMPASATCSYPSALPIKFIKVSPETQEAAAGAGGRGGSDKVSLGSDKVSLAPLPAGHWFRQKRASDQIEDASPAVAKATYPQQASRELFETCAMRFSRSVEAGGSEPELSYVLAALAVLTGDKDVALWDPFASNAAPPKSPLRPHGDTHAAELVNEVNLLYWRKSTCFTSTKVQIVTPEALSGSSAKPLLIAGGTPRCSITQVR